MRAFCRVSGFTGVLVAAACLVGPAAASAASGNLRFDGCFAGASSSVPCHRQAAGIQAPRDIAVSPDGRDVYVASIDGDVARLHRNQASGRLAPRGCVADVSVDPTFTDCSRQAPGLFEASTIAISPDGTSVYVGGPETISEFSRGFHGRLKFVACAADTPQGANDTAGNGCTLTRDGIGGHALAVSPDGRFVYAASDTNSAITELARDQDSGELSFSQCAVASDVPAQETQPTANCGLQSPALFDVADLAVSPDGAGVYGISGVG